VTGPWTDPVVTRVRAAETGKDDADAGKGPPVFEFGNE
jgi:hypothetical protein